MSKSNRSKGGKSKSYLRFFLGTPKRFMWSMLSIGLVVAAVSPGLVMAAVNALLVALSPLIAPVLSIAIVFAGLRVMVFGRR